MFLRLTLIGCCLLLPSVSQAAITFSEVAWMGNSESANNEWIELYNNGATQSVDGWRLTDGMNLDITLTGSVAAGHYAVLERTDDASAPGTAFMIYTGALSNAGATLTLYDAAGAMVDQLSGGENWENIGGDNATKETAQFSSSDGWITAPATPAQANATEGTVTDDEEEEDDTADENNESANETEVATPVVTAKNNDTPATLHLIPRELSVRITAPERVYRNQAVQFVATPSGVSKAILQSVQYEWNFGDVTTSSKQSPTHRYTHPGQYVVTLKVAYKEYEATYRKSITVLPVTMSVSTLPSGEVQVHNNARYEVDVSGYRLGGVTFPKRSIMLPGSTITLPRSKVGQSLVLLDEVKTEVARAGVTQPLALATAPTAPLVANVAVAPTAPLLTPDTAPTVAAERESEPVATDSRFGFAGDTSTDVELTEGSRQVAGRATTVVNLPATTTFAFAPTQIDEPVSEPVTDNRPYYALLALIGLGLFGVYVRQY